MAQGRALIAQAEAGNLLLGCAPDTFLGAGGRLARRIADDGRVGKILSGTAFLLSHGMEHWHPDPEFFFKPGGGPVLDMAPYYLSALVNLLGPVTRAQARTSTGFGERIVSSDGPRKGDRIRVETPTTVMALLSFAAGADVMLAMSWDVWKHGHPPIELYGTEGSLRVPDPNFFGGVVAHTQRGDDWQIADCAAMPFGKPNWRAPGWPPAAPDLANYRGLGVAEMASAIRNRTPHRATGRLAGHVLETMHAILSAGESLGSIEILSRVDRPPAMSDGEALALWRRAAREPS